MLHIVHGAGGRADGPTHRREVFRRVEPQGQIGQATEVGPHADEAAVPGESGGKGARILPGRNAEKVAPSTGGRGGVRKVPATPRALHAGRCRLLTSLLDVVGVAQVHLARTEDVIVGLRIGVPLPLGQVPLRCAGQEQRLDDLWLPSAGVARAGAFQKGRSASGDDRARIAGGRLVDDEVRLHAATAVGVAAALAVAAGEHACGDGMMAVAEKDRQGCRGVAQAHHGAASIPVDHEVKAPQHLRIDGRVSGIADPAVILHQPREDRRGIASVEPGQKVHRIVAVDLRRTPGHPAAVGVKVARNRQRMVGEGAGARFRMKGLPSVDARAGESIRAARLRQVFGDVSGRAGLGLHQRNRRSRRHRRPQLGGQLGVADVIQPVRRCEGRETKPRHDPQARRRGTGQVGNPWRLRHAKRWKQTPAALKR